MAKLTYCELRLLEVAAVQRGDHETARMCLDAIGGGDTWPDGRTALVLERMVADGRLKVPHLDVGNPFERAAAEADRWAKEETACDPEADILRAFADRLREWK
jgi:hypothetical protein